MCPLNIHVHDVIVLIFRIVFFCFIGSIERVEEAAATKCGCHRSWFIVSFFSPGVSVLESMSSYNVSFASNGMLGLSLRNLSLSCCVSVPASLCPCYLCDISVISLRMCFRGCSDP